MESCPEKHWENSMCTGYRKGYKAQQDCHFTHTKCLKYVFNKNAVDKNKLREHLCALIPNQFGGHS